MVDPRSRVLFVITQDKWGGAQRYVLDLARHLLEAWDVSIAVGGEPDTEGGLLERARALGSGPRLELIRLRRLERRLGAVSDLRGWLELVALYRRRRPDLVHLNSTKAGVLGAFARLASPSTRIVYTVHGWVFNEPLSVGRRWLYRALERSSALCKDRLIVLTEGERVDGIDSLGIDRARISLIPHGIEARTDYATAREARRQLADRSGGRLDPELRWIGTIASAYPTKGLDLLVEAAAAMPVVRRGAAQVVVIGSGPQLGELRTMVDARGLSGAVCFVGFIEDAARYLGALDLFVLSSRKEGFPYVLLEAMQAGVPIVATRVRGASALLTDRRSGWLVPTEDPSALGAALTTALEDPQTARDCADRARHVVSEYSIDRMVRQTAQLYRAVIDGRGRGSPPEGGSSDPDHER